MNQINIKELSLTQAIEITKLVAPGHQHPDVVLTDLYSALVKLNTETRQTQQ